ncbi:uncharacterized protein Z519_12736 [Cladophialophora bantiana CBS 173.52]|uniref:RING-type domain-containing protein n=1 Tax=Cladophialophora bantiana (strain ATCC 10958 / CBS 173.52 / CDC B-1940 / NIH 8579) TaxID=1442370 RepID=A0A0D2E979_CLAB1|nr:uncharacterized protein Z519_12736 [Cladophialophora bantiana CBS 173.52]KIW86681.1 hypothetical protein Z519_12736 [Cladophialophora bantiana CBS 173.52]
MNQSLNQTLVIDLKDDSDDDLPSLSDLFPSRRNRDAASRYDAPSSQRHAHPPAPLLLQTPENCSDEEEGGSVVASPSGKDIAKVSERQFDFNATHFLDDNEDDIVNEYNGILDSAVAIKHKCGTLTTRIQELKAALKAKQAELDQITLRRQRELLSYGESAKMAQDRLRAKGAKLRKCNREIKSLRRRNGHLAEDLEIASKDLARIKKHLHCDICADTFKNVVTRCGHSYCAECLATWLGGVNESDLDCPTDQWKRGCPMCRRALRAEDIWPIFLGAEGSSIEVVCTDSDGE